MFRLSQDEEFEKSKLPDIAVVDEKTGKIISSSNLAYKEARILQTAGDLKRKLEAIGVYVGDINEFPDFDDIVGREDLKKIFKSAVDKDDIKSWLLRESKQQPVSLLLYGPPGTGKTTFVKASAKEYSKRVGKDNVVYLEVKNIESPYVGETARRINELVKVVKELRKQGKHVFVVIDEVDRLVPSRSLFGSGAKRDTTTALLTAINELKDAGANVFAMTNDPASVDKAFLDRFPARVKVPLPDKNEIKNYMDRLLSDAARQKINTSDLAKLFEENGASFRDVENFIRLYLLNSLESKEQLNNDFVKKIAEEYFKNKKDQDNRYV